MNQKILLVEDNKALAKLLAKKMQKALNAHVDVAYDMAKAKALIAENNDYFIALLDLNLPDAPNGEVVDYVLSKNILSIVLTGNIDEKTKATFVDKPIVDYVYKGNMDDVNYIFTMIDRLYKNRKYKVMVVDDSIPTRNRTKEMLKSQQFQVFAAAHGEEALSYFEDHPDIKLVITDFFMPVIDGMELVFKLREKYSKNELAIIAMTAHGEDSTAARFLKHGANDFIVKPFGKEEMICRVNNSIEALENIATIANLDNVDFMTGAYNRTYFFREAANYLKEKNVTEECALAMIDIDECRKLNDTYGHDAGDVVIKSLVKMLKDESKGADMVVRYGGQEFVLFLKNVPKNQAVSWFVKLRAKIAHTPLKVGNNKLSYTVSMGLSFNEEEGIEGMIEKADNALIEAKKNGRNRVELEQE